VNGEHRAVGWIVVRVVGDERFGGRSEVLHLLDEPQFARTNGARAALPAHLDGAQGFTRARRAVAVRRDDAMKSAVVELEECMVSDRGADDVVHALSP
jgi:hypothetical protein